MQHITDNQHTIDNILFWKQNTADDDDDLFFSLFVYFVLLFVQYGDYRLYLAQEECLIHTVCIN